jgi:site-specific recombinase XerD
VQGKGDKTRTVYLTETTKAAILDWLDVRAQLVDDSEPALFVSMDNRSGSHRMTAHALRYMVDRYLDRLGLKQQGISCHSLRHSAATWARAGGAKLDAFGGMRGHASVTTTQVYAKNVDRMTENPAKYLQAMVMA